MISEATKKIELITNNIEERLNVDKVDFLASCIKTRLNKSLNQYYNELNKSLDKLSMCDDKYRLRLIRKLNKGD